MAINVIGGRAVLLENTNPAGNWLQIQLEDFAPGTIAIVTLPDGTERVREWHTGSSYLASEDPRLHFGLGDIQTSVDLQIVYRGERQIELNGITPNQQLVLTVIRQE
ncbi:MAG: ASPIC/UnbV domain-containing protein [Chloroflexota bacterium]